MFQGKKEIEHSVVLLSLFTQGNLFFHDQSWLLSTLVTAVPMHLGTGTGFLVTAVLVDQHQQLGGWWFGGRVGVMQYTHTMPSDVCLLTAVRVDQHQQPWGIGSVM